MEEKKLNTRNKLIPIKADLLKSAREQIANARLEKLAKEQAFKDMREAGLNVAYIEIVDNMD